MLPPLLSTLLRYRHGHRHSLRRFLLHLHYQPCNLFSSTTSLPLYFPLSHPTYMIWGSNTSLGKTLVSTGLASSFLLPPPPQSSSTSDSGRRRKFVYFKPVQTGFPSDSDSHFVFSKLSSIASRYNLPFSLIASNSVLKSSLSAAKSVISVGGHFETDEFKFGMYNLNFRERNAVLKDGYAVSELVSKTLYAWREAVSPHLAAERENGVAEDSAVVEMLQQCLINELEVEGKNEQMNIFCVVETAGGVASPGPSGTLQCDLYRYVTIISFTFAYFSV